MRTHLLLASLVANSMLVAPSPPAYADPSDGADYVKSVFYGGEEKVRAWYFDDTNTVCVRLFSTVDAVNVQGWVSLINIAQHAGPGAADRGGDRKATCVEISGSPWFVENAQWKGTVTWDGTGGNYKEVTFFGRF